MTARKLLALLFAILPCSLTAEPFTLSDLRIAAPRLSPRSVSIGGAADGFLLAGIASHQPVTIPLSLEGNPTSLGNRSVGIESASHAGEPVRVGDRWIVPVSTDFLAPDRFLLSEVLPDGSLAGQPVTIPWPRFAGGSIAWNGRTLLLVGVRKNDASFLIDLVARTASPDLTIIGEEKVIASSIHLFRAVPASDGFFIVYKTDGGVFVVRLSDSGAVIGSPTQLSTGKVTGGLDAATGPGGTIIAWSDGPASSWSINRARIASGGSFEILPPIPSLEGDRIHFRVCPLGEGFLLSWQEADYAEGILRGREILWTRQNASGELGPIHEVRGLVGGEALVGVGSNGETALLAWERHIVGVGIPLFGATISGDTISEPKLISLAYTTAETLDVSSPGDQTTFALWRETSGTGTTLFAGRWSREGERLALQSLFAVEGALGEIALVSGGGETLFLWEYGNFILGVWLGDDASFRGEPFLVAESLGPYERVPRKPAASWDGTRFLVVWVEEGELEGAFIAPSGVVSLLGVIANPPSPRAHSGYDIVSARVASGAEGSLVAVEVVERFFCVGVPCPITYHVGSARLDRDGKSLTGTVELFSRGLSPGLATDGRDFLVSWRDPEGVRVRLFPARDDQPPVDRLLFAHPSPASTAVIWNGTDYVVAWGGPRIHVARLDRTGAPTQPLASIEGFSEFIGGRLALGALPGDAFVSWIDVLDQGTASAQIPVADFLRNAAALPPRPSAPEGVTIGRVDRFRIDMFWIPVAGATGYWIEMLHRDAEGSRWLTKQVIDGGETDSVRMWIGEEESIRIRALGVGGSSEAVEKTIPPLRRRAVRR